MDLPSRVHAATGARVRSSRRLSGGCIADVLLVELEGGTRVVCKPLTPEHARLEAAMLRALAERSSLPVPAVLHEAEGLLILEHIEHDGQVGEGAERHAAELLADLHAVRGQAFGFEHDTLIGPLAQPCPATASWVAFFAEHRLRHFGALASRKGAISESCWDGLQRLADRLGEFLDEPEHPSLIHGDVWGGNVLAHRDRIAAFIDPAVHYAHPEVELAFTTLFSAFGPAFYLRYSEIRPIRAGFFEHRRGIYNLYPLLVHAILFGGGYGDQVERALRAAVA